MIATWVCKKNSLIKEKKSLYRVSKSAVKTKKKFIRASGKTCLVRSHIFRYGLPENVLRKGQKD